MGRMFAEACSSAAPYAIGRCAIDRAYLAPVIEIFSMLTEYRQECGVKVIKLEKPRQVVVCFMGHVVSPHFNYSMVGVGSQSYFPITTILFEILLTGFIFLRSLNIGINSAIPSARL